MKDTHQKMKTPTFSLVIPVFNVEPYLRECLDSILAQEYEDFEICLIDDGSNDGSEKICDEYAQKYKRFINLVHQSNAGVSEARNKALDLARGKYIWFIDSDDYIYNGSLSYLDKIANKDNFDTLFFGNKNYAIHDIFGYNIVNKESYLSKNPCYCNPFIIFDRDLIEHYKIRFTPGITMGEDLEFQYKYLLHASRLATIPYNFYFIRERPGSASRNGTTQRANLLGAKNLLDNISNYLSHEIVEDNIWIRSRLSERLKCFLHASSETKEYNTQATKRYFFNYLNKFNNLGIEHIEDGPLKIAKLNISLYNVLYKIIYILRKR